MSLSRRSFVQTLGVGATGLWGPPGSYVASSSESAATIHFRSFSVGSPDRLNNSHAHSVACLVISNCVVMPA